MAWFWKYASTVGSVNSSSAPMVLMKTSSTMAVWTIRETFSRSSAPLPSRVGTSPAFSKPYL
jgi:hypothetical protein